MGRMSFMFHRVSNGFNFGQEVKKIPDSVIRVLTNHLFYQGYLFGERHVRVLER